MGQILTPRRAPLKWFFFCLLFFLQTPVAARVIGLCMCVPGHQRNDLCGRCDSRSLLSKDQVLALFWSSDGREPLKSACPALTGTFQELLFGAVASPALQCMLSLCPLAHLALVTLATASFVKPKCLLPQSPALTGSVSDTECTGLK